MENLEKVSEGGEVETTGGYFYRPAGNSSYFVAIEFLSQITNTRMSIKNVGKYNSASEAKLSNKREIFFSNKYSLENRKH